ncbi:uncharacterized protein [Miscanthus floridulus]|uniref:uncharacterized protein isoform X2 n=1 Tax=Miscanthus floridulus TaxID=154761 RepID=UPI003459314A
MAEASVWLQLPPHRLHSPLLSLPSNHSSSACPPAYKKHAVLGPGRGNLLLCGASGTTSSVVTKEQEGAASDPSSEEGSPEPEIYSYKDDPNFRGCKGCGREEVERGCNGEGRIQGGIAAVPGFGWWPIKAYRPCPGFVASGGRYRRQGQSMDDVASGRGKKKPTPAQKKR